MRPRKRKYVDRPSQKCMLLQKLMGSHHTSEGMRNMNFVHSSDLKTIDLDVQRSAAHWDVHRHLSAAERERIRTALRTTVFNVISSCQGLRYYQGIHEICLVVLQATNIDVEMTSSICRSIMLKHFTSLLYHDFSVSLTPLLEGLQYLVETTDPELARILESSGVGYHFSVPWLLTWFAHSVNDFDSICLIYRHLLDQDPIDNPFSCLYLCCAVIAQQRETIIRNYHDSCRIFQTLQTSPQCADFKFAIKSAMMMEANNPVREIVANCPKLAEARVFTQMRGKKVIHIGIALGVSVLALLSYFVLPIDRLATFMQ